jgi:hypothetical protein
LVDPWQINPALRIGDVRRNQMKFSGVNVGWIPKLLHMAGQQEVERLYPIAILLATIISATELTTTSSLTSNS